MRKITVGLFVLFLSIPCVATAKDFSLIAATPKAVVKAAKATGKGAKVTGKVAKKVVVVSVRSVGKFLF